MAVSEPLHPGVGQFRSLDTISCSFELLSSFTLRQHGRWYSSLQPT